MPSNGLMPTRKAQSLRSSIVELLVMSGMMKRLLHGTMMLLQLIDIKTAGSNSCSTSSQSLLLEFLQELKLFEHV
jgi:hypothetical protein